MSLLSPEAFENIGWTLVHFLWQGTALALLLYVFVAFTRDAALRYYASFVTLLLMAFAPVITFGVLAASPAQPPHSSIREVLFELSPVAASTGAKNFFGAPAANSLLQMNWMQMLCGIWIAGVAIFSLRALGGFMVVRKLLREKREPFSRELRATCLSLQRRLGLTRTVQYFHSHLVSAPAVVGWARPVILVPFSALSGMTVEQLEAVLLHELAHIQRWDSFVNLFQIAVETVLFYHPAVWWVSRFMRNERENCCDDIAVKVCGNPVVYARALTEIETLRQSPSVILAVNSGVLKSRVSRILGLDVVVRSLPQSGVAVLACISVAGVLLSAGTVREVLLSQNDASEAITQVATPASGAAIPPAVPLPPAAPTTPEPVHAARAPQAKRPISRSITVTTGPATFLSPMTPLPPVPPVAVAFAAEQNVPPPPPPPAPSAEARGSYIGDLRSAGLKDLTVDELIALKTQGVTPEYVKDMKAAGFDGSLGEVIAMKMQGVTPDYVRRVREAGFRDARLGEILAMKVQGIDPAQASEFRRTFGFHDLSMGQIIAFKAQGITPDYVRGLQAAGLKNLRSGEIIAAKVQGITPQFVEKVRAQGFSDLSIQQLIRLKTAGIF